MTAVETAAPPSKRSGARHLLAFGTGVAIEITDDRPGNASLELTVVRARPGGPRVLTRATIVHFRERPAAEWSQVYRDAVRGHEPAGVVVLLPRRDIIARHVALPGVPKRELAGAIALRLRGLHPFPEDDVAWCWTPASNGALVGLVRLSALGRYESLFAEAGIPVASFTFSASVLYSALRLYGEPALPFMGLTETGAGLIEAYGESASGIFSSEFLGSASLRLPVGTEPVDLTLLLPAPRGERSDDDEQFAPLVDRPLLFAAALCAACPLLLRPANFLPAERRAGQSRIWLIPTVFLALVLLLAVIAVFAIGPYRERSYLAALHQQINQAAPLAARSLALDRQVDHSRANIQLLDAFRNRAHSDFDVLNELTRILPPPTWTSLVEIYPDYVVIAGEAEQAAPLLKILDGSPLFQNSEFSNSVSRSGKDEVFRIKTYRRRK